MKLPPLVKKSKSVSKILKDGKATKPIKKVKLQKKIKKVKKDLNGKPKINKEPQKSDESDLEEEKPEVTEKKSVKERKIKKDLNGKAKTSKMSQECDKSDIEEESFEDSEKGEEQSQKKSKSDKKKLKMKTKVQSKEKKASSKNAVAKHKKQLENLKNIDPEFYEFLKKNDKKLLAFNLDESDEEDDEAEKSDVEEDASDEEEEDKTLHKPVKQLEAASDEEDFQASGDEEEVDEDEGAKITLKMLRTWQSELQSDSVPVNTIRKAIKAFSSALFSVSGQASKGAVYQVEGGAIFNGVVQLCVIYLQPALYKFLKLSPKSKQPIHKCKKWGKVKSCLRIYLQDLSRLLEHATSPNILSVLLKHLHKISSIVSSFPTISKPIMKRLISLWSTSEETVRILAFLCILKITREQQGLLLNHVLKSMYMCYVRNSKFVSPQTLPAINFMRQSLVEMFALDLTLTYQHAFLYIRQLAIHLRNAIILKKKDSFQAVYNWQFINSLKLWGDLLGNTATKPQLQPLIYPLVSITIGVIKLIPTAQFFPLRFHCIRILISLSKQTHTFIPVLPFILEVLNSNTFNKKHTIVSMKPMQFTCILRLNKPQMAENGFRDEVIENVCGLTLEYLEHESSSLAFPDLVVPAVVALKNYLKTCKNANYTRKLKQVVDKIIETSKFVEDERNKITFSLKDMNLIHSWEIQMRNKGTPLSIYYSSWVKTYETKRKRQAANTDDINDYNIPVIKKKRIGDGNQRRIEKDGPVELFPSDTEDEQLDVEMEKEIKKDKKKKDKKNAKKVERDDGALEQQQQQIENEANDYDDAGNVDIVKDLDLDDW